jgi:hypothetical protein
MFCPFTWILWSVGVPESDRSNFDASRPFCFEHHHKTLVVQGHRDTVFLGDTLFGEAPALVQVAGFCNWHGAITSSLSRVARQFQCEPRSISVETRANNRRWLTGSSTALAICSACKIPAPGCWWTWCCLAASVILHIEQDHAVKLGFSSATELEHLDIRGLFSFGARRHIKGNFWILGERFKAPR